MIARLARGGAINLLVASLRHHELHAFTVARILDLLVSMTQIALEVPARDGEGGEDGAGGGERGAERVPLCPLAVLRGVPWLLSFLDGLARRTRRAGPGFTASDQRSILDNVEVLVNRLGLPRGPTLAPGVPPHPTPGEAGFTWWAHRPAHPRLG